MRHLNNDSFSVQRIDHPELPGKLTHLHSARDNIDLWTFRPGEATTEQVFDIISDAIEDELRCQSDPLNNLNVPD